MPTAHEATRDARASQAQGNASDFELRTKWSSLQCRACLHRSGYSIWLASSKSTFLAFVHSCSFAQDVGLGFGRFGMGGWVGGGGIGPLNFVSVDLPTVILTWA